VTPMRIAFFIFALVAAGSARAQLLAAPGPAIAAERPATIRNLVAFPQLSGVAQGLPPDDPLAPYLYQADPKLYARADFNANVAIETTLTNPDYLDRLKYVGNQPRLAQGAVLGAHGLDVQLAARLTLPIDEHVGIFTKTGVAGMGRKSLGAAATSLGPWVSVGVTYKLDNGQTATAEIPLATIARKIMGGVAGGHAARLNLGF